VHYYPLSTNAGVRDTPAGLSFEAAPNREANYWSTAVVAANGEYRICVPSGPGVLIVQSAPGMPDWMGLGLGHWKESEGFHRLFPYAVLSGRTRDDGAPGGDRTSLPGLNGPIGLVDRNYHAYRVIDPPADATKMDLTLEIPRAPSRTFRFVDPEGRAVRGVRVQGLLAPPNGMTIDFDGSEAEVLALEPGHPREVVLTSLDGQYAAVAVVSTDDPEPRTVRLEKAASLSARLLDDSTGEPLREFGATLIYPSEGAAPNDRKYHWGGHVEADGKGRVVFRTVIPGTSASIWLRGALDIGFQSREYKLDVLRGLTLPAGEVRDLGDIRIPVTDAKAKSKPGN
jgi:hypothetical protein